jgi:hypothetical protein
MLETYLLYDNLYAYPLPDFNQENVTIMLYAQTNLKSVHKLILMGSTFSRILIFNLIFKNSTSESHYHKAVQLLFVGLFGVSSVGGIAHEGDISSQGIDTRVIDRVAKMLFFGGIFMISGKLAEKEWKKESDDRWHTTKRYLLNFITILFESLCIEQTLGFGFSKGMYIHELQKDIAEELVDSYKYFDKTNKLT